MTASLEGCRPPFSGSWDFGSSRTRTAPGQESVVSGGPPTHGSVHCGMQLSRRRRVCRDTVTLYPVTPVPAWIKRARDHLVAENAKIGGFLMNPSQ